MATMREQEDFHSRHRFRHHPQAVLTAWARSLRFFRFVSGPGGMLDHGDFLLVALRAPQHRDLADIFSALGAAVRPQPPDSVNHGIGYVAFTPPPPEAAGSPPAAPPPLGLVRIAGATVVAYWTGDTLELSLSDETQPSEVTAAAVAAAQRIEPRLEPLAGRIVDPPQDDRHCLCPKYHPDLWSPEAPHDRGNKRARQSRRRRWPAALALLLGAGLMVLAILIGWDLAPAAHGATAPRHALIRLLHELGGWTLAVGTFLIPGLFLLHRAWRGLNSRPRDGSTPHPTPPERSARE
jgi:hypothetical protein